MAEEFLFPYERVRNVQKDMLKDVTEAIRSKKNIIVHAPTGLGKTVAALAPALKEAIDRDLTVFFLTSRHTQHRIAVDTLKEIKNKHKVEFNAVDLIGKKWMCSVPGSDILYSGEFADYCKEMREKGTCEFYKNTKSSNSLAVSAKKVLDDLAQLNPCHVENVISMCADDKLCPYEISIALAAKSKVIISDYFYVFNPFIRKSFLAKTKKELGNCIIIVDEGHNLPYRIRDLATEKLSNQTIKKSIKEAKRFKFGEAIGILSRLQDILNKYSSDMLEGHEKLVSKEKFIGDVSKIKDYEEIIAELEFVGDEIRISQKQSFTAAVARFLEAWKGPDEGFARIFSVDQVKHQSVVSISYRCLDPSLLTKEVIENAYSTVIMSGTLTPTPLYKDLLGFPDETMEREYESPFDEDNKLMIIIPETTTKFTMRTPMQFKRIAEICAKVTDTVPGNSAIFFPSYKLRDEIYQFLYELCKKRCFLEQPRMTKQEKAEMLEKFKAYKSKGAVLLGVATGSFGEGVDLPGDLLKCVVVVGLPLQQPDLETKELISYYQEKFGRGVDYGYIFPAFTKCLQNAGRCVRSENDKGVVVFLDERFTWPIYSRCFPKDSNIVVTTHYQEQIEDFFDR